jgi:hypothetical protein
MHLIASQISSIDRVGTGESTMTRSGRNRFICRSEELGFSKGAT